MDGRVVSVCIALKFYFFLIIWQENSQDKS